MSWYWHRRLPIFNLQKLVELDIFKKLFLQWWFLQKSGRNHRKNYDTKYNKKWQMGAMWHKTQRTENLFGRRKYLPDPAPPALAPASVFVCVSVSQSVISLLIHLWKTARAQQIWSISMYKLWIVGKLWVRNSSK